MPSIKHLLYVVLIFLTLIDCQHVKKIKQNENIICKEAYTLIQKYKSDKDFVIVDFRPEKKYNKAHIKNAIFFDVFSNKIDVWLDSLNRQKTYLIYCTRGNRSSIALNKMKKMGFKNVYHMFQGINSWKKNGYAVISKN